MCDKKKKKKKKASVAWLRPLKDDVGDPCVTKKKKKKKKKKQHTWLQCLKDDVEDPCDKKKKKKGQPLYHHCVVVTPADMHLVASTREGQLEAGNKKRRGLYLAK